jgi:formylglycine-generating enzyme required for sulfatase activity
MRRVCLAMLAVLAPTAAMAQRRAEPPRWEERLTNPAPADGDKVLPMPCGGAMVFREVTVPASANPLDDRAVTIGSPELERGYDQYLRNTFLAAPFPAADGARSYWIGKYEVTRLQFATLTETSCPSPDTNSRRPAAELSWYEAVAFTERYSTWLLAHAAAQLPERDGMRGFVRLPTETEWEYAARGGSAVGPADFAAPTYPMEEGVDRYEWAGSQRTAGQAQPVGGLLPNPLGLHDMLGNVSELMLEPFRLNRVGRDHGQAGGFIARGGHFAMTPDVLATVQREELPPFDARAGRASRSRQVGFRVVLGLPATTTLQQAEALREAFAREAATRDNAAEDPRAYLRQLLAEAPEGSPQRAALTRLDAQLATDARARDDARRLALRSQIQSAAALGLVVWTQQERLNALEALRNRALAEAAPLPQPQRGQAEAQIRQVNTERARELEALLAPALDGYAATLQQIGTGAPRGMVAEQFGVVRQELRQRSPRLMPFVELADRHAIAVTSGTVPEPARLRRDLASVPAQ